MGYTHYWTQTRDFTPDQMGDIAAHDGRRAAGAVMVQIGDICRWTNGWEYEIDPPMWSIVTGIYSDHYSTTVFGLIVDRGGLTPSTALGGQVSYPIDYKSSGVEIIPKEDVPDELWAKIALVQMLGEGEKPN